MAMSNEQIIECARQMNGIEEIIHTFEGWKSIGFKVKKGEKALIRISIWKKGKDKEKEIDQPGGKKTITVSGNYFLKESCFFGMHQVEPIK